MCKKGGKLVGICEILAHFCAEKVQFVKMNNFSCSQKMPLDSIESTAHFLCKKRDEKCVTRELNILWTSMVPKKIAE